LIYVSIKEYSVFTCFTSLHYVTILTANSTANKRGSGMWTDKSIKSLKPREQRYRLSEDTKQRGLGRLVIDIQPNNVKTFFYQYFRKEDGKSKRVLINIGRYKDSAKVPGYTLSEAREKTLELVDISKKGDIKDSLADDDKRKQEETKRRETVQVTLQQILNSYTSEKDLKPGTIKDYKKAMNETFGDYLEKPITDISRETILSIYRKRSQKSIARTNNAMRVFRALYNYHRAITRQDDGTYLLPDNPVSILREAQVLKKVNRRKEFIHKDKLKAWFTAVLNLNNKTLTSGNVVRDYLIFILLTGVRREEATSLQVDQISLDRGIFTLTDTKNNEVVELPMSDYVYDLVRSRMENLKGTYLFPGNQDDKPIGSFKRPMDHLWKETKFHFTIHDLRRTFITVAESMDISVYTIKRLVNHKIDNSSDVTAGYVGMDIERMRAATQQITNQILTHAKIKKSLAKVISIKGKRT